MIIKKKRNKWVLSANEANELSSPIVKILKDVDLAIKTACSNGEKRTYVSINTQFKDEVLKILKSLKYSCEFNDQGGISGKNLKIEW